MSVPITPETKLEELLDRSPDLERALAECLPALLQLHNPVLRKIFLRSASLEDAARLCGLDTRDLVLKVREIAGQPARDPEVTAQPFDASGVRTVERIDADSMLAAGVHPVGRVREACEKLAPGEAVEMTVGFRPAPLIDLMQRCGYTVTCEGSTAGGYVVRFIRL